MFLPAVREGDWTQVRKNFQKLSSLKLGDRADVTFAELTLTGLTASQLLQTDTNKKLVSIALPLIVAKGGTGATTFTDGGILLGSGTGAITALGVASNGQIPIGDNSTDPVLATITGTENQAAVTNGAGSITLSLPQNIHTGASPTFAGLTITHAAVLGSDSVVFQPNTDATDFFQVLDADGGTPIFSIDTTNERIGIRTTPGTLLHIKEITAGAEDDPVEMLRLELSDDDDINLSAGGGPALTFYVAEDGASQLGAQIVARRESATDANADTSLTFWTAANDASSTEKVRIDSAGNVGFGITPTEFVHISNTCTVGSSKSFLRVTGLQVDGTEMEQTLRGAYIDISNGSTAATGTIRGMELKARTEAPGDTGNDVAVLEGLSISADSKGHSVTTMRAAEFILDGSSGGTITEAVGLRIANNLQANKATASYGLQIYRDSFDYTYDISLSLGGHITGDSYVNQDLRIAASPTFAGGTFTGVVTGVSPTTGDHLATKEYVDLAIGTEIDFFLSNTASGVGSNYLMYPHDTGEGQSTLNSAALGVNDNQLAFSFLTEAGQPALKYLRDGVYDLHTHLNNNTGNKPTTIYWTLSYVDADGSSNETLVVTGETSSELTNSSTVYDLHAVLTPEVNIAITKRLLVKLYANVSSGGSNSVITITMEGTTDSHVSVEAPSDIWQRYGAVLDDLNTLGIVGANSEFLVGTAEGVLDWENAATARTSLGVGTGNSPTFAGTTLTNAAVIGVNSVVFQPAADSTTFFQVNDEDGNVIANVDTVNNRVGFGTDEPGARVQVNTAAQTSIIARRASNDTAGAAIVNEKARGTHDTPLIVEEDDVMGGFTGRGYDGDGNWTNSAAIRFYIDGTPGTPNDMPGRIEFETTPDGFGTTRTRMVIKEDGKIGIAQDTPLSLLHLKTQDEAITLEGTNTGAALAIFSINWINTDVTSQYTAASIRSYNAGGTDDGDLRFYTCQNTSLALQMTIDEDGGIHIPNMKSGINQGASGAAAGELWFDTDDDNTVKMGV